MDAWMWVLIVWFVVAFVVAVPLGRALKRSRLRMEANERFYKDQQRRNRSRWN